MTCIFCKIVNREIPAKIVLETEDILAFEDINPQAPVHVVVIPKRHVEMVQDLGEDCSKIMVAVSSVANIKGVDVSGFRTVVNSGRDAGQAVPHIHFHVLGGRGLHWPPG